jgi:hypothetical protein
LRARSARGPTGQAAVSSTLFTGFDADGNIHLTFADGTMIWTPSPLPELRERLRGRRNLLLRVLAEYLPEAVCSRLSFTTPAIGEIDDGIRRLAAAVYAVSAALIPEPG